MLNEKKKHPSHNPTLTGWDPLLVLDHHHHWLTRRGNSPRVEEDYIDMPISGTSNLHWIIPKSTNKNTGTNLVAILPSYRCCLRKEKLFPVNSRGRKDFEGGNSRAHFERKIATQNFFVAKYLLVHTQCLGCKIEQQKVEEIVFFELHCNSFGFCLFWMEIAEWGLHSAREREKINLVNRIGRHSFGLFQLLRWWWKNTCVSINEKVQSRKFSGTKVQFSGRI